MISPLLPRLEDAPQVHIEDLSLTSLPLGSGALVGRDGVSQGREAVGDPLVPADDLFAWASDFVRRQGRPSNIWILDGDGGVL